MTLLTAGNNRLTCMRVEQNLIIAPQQEILPAGTTCRCQRQNYSTAAHLQEVLWEAIHVSSTRKNNQLAQHPCCSTCMQVLCYSMQSTITVDLHLGMLYSMAFTASFQPRRHSRTSAELIRKARSATLSRQLIHLTECVFLNMWRCQVMIDPDRDVHHTVFSYTPSM